MYCVWTKPSVLILDRKWFLLFRLTVTGTVLGLSLFPIKGSLLPGHSLKTETFEFIELIIVTWDLHLQKKLYFFLIDLHYVDNFWELALQPWDIHPQSFCVKCQCQNRPMLNHCLVSILLSLCPISLKLKL